MELNFSMACSCQLGPRFPHAWTRVLGLLQVLTPLRIALHSSTLSQTAAAPTSAPVPDGGAQCEAGERHDS